MKRRQSQAHRYVHSGAARDSADRAYARGLKSEQPAPEPFKVDMDALIAGMAVADPIDLVEIRSALEHYARTNPLGYFLKTSIERVQQAHLRYAEQQKQAEQNAA